MVKVYNVISNYQHILLCVRALAENLQQMCKRNLDKGLWIFITANVTMCVCVWAQRFFSLSEESLQAPDAKKRGHRADKHY